VNCRSLVAGDISLDPQAIRMDVTLGNPAEDDSKPWLSHDFPRKITCGIATCACPAREDWIG